MFAVKKKLCMFVAHLLCIDVWMRTRTCFTNKSGGSDDMLDMKRKENVSKHFRNFSFDRTLSFLPRCFASMFAMMFHNQTHFVLGCIDNRNK
jgi:hypothetical protein